MRLVQGTKRQTKPDGNERRPGPAHRPPRQTPAQRAFTQSAETCRRRSPAGVKTGAHLHTHGRAPYAPCYAPCGLALAPAPRLPLAWHMRPWGWTAHFCCRLLVASEKMRSATGSPSYSYACSATRARSSSISGGSWWLGEELIDQPKKQTSL